MAGAEGCMSDEPRQLGKCVRCDKPVMSLGGPCEDNPDRAMEGEMLGHYGSRNDCSKFTCWICDDCAHVVSCGQMIGWLGPFDGKPHRSYSKEDYAAAMIKRGDGE